MYPLTMQEKAVLIRDFFNGVALNDISRTFFLSYHKPLSAPTIYRCIVRSGSGLWNAVQRYTIENWSERIEVGRIWEGDGTPLTADKWLLIVKDDKANMVLSRVFDRSENAKSVKKLLNAAKKIYGEPERFRCDGSRAFISAAIECRKFRVELWRCQSGGFHVSVQPIEYLGKEEFKRWIRLCKRNFMTLASRQPWRFENAFSQYQDATLFAKALARQLGECAFFDRSKGQLTLVTPKEETT